MKKEVINKVRKYRREAGITQEKLANKVGVTRQTIIAVEKGNYTPSVSLALSLSRFFKVRVEDVFKLE